MRRFAWTCGVAGLTAVLAGSVGCEVDRPVEHRHRDYVVYHEPPPPAIVVAPAPPPPEPVVIYQTDPPPPPVEVIPVAPGPDFIWVGGRYYHERGGWVYHRGYYDRRHYR